MAELVFHPADNVAVLTDLDDAGRRGHKRATRNIAKGEAIVKFGHVMGVASESIQSGEHVHTHNVVMPSPNDFRLLSEQRHTTSSVSSQSLLPSDDLPGSFEGYERPGRDWVGTRNYVAVVASVNCSATVVKAICRRFEGKALPDGIDGVIPVTHGQGCAQELGGTGYALLNRTLAGWIFHPNVVGTLVVGLGCEGTTFESILKHSHGLAGSIPLKHIGIQSVGGTTEAIDKGVRAVEALVSELPSMKRTSQPVSRLKVALNCGGSDAFSSITANPLLGHVSDALVEAGGCVGLAEIPECHGTEELLYARAQSKAVEQKLKRVFGWWEEYSKLHNVELNDNLAPGNIAGGITTIAEKSLGAVAKAGVSQLTDVVDYAEPMVEAGFNLMNTPGFDPVSVTGLVAGGCNLVVFTTGRGSVYGCSIAPTVKVATTSDLFRRMPGDMDFDAGVTLEGASVQEAGTELYRMLVDVASGRPTQSEKLGLGWEEFVPWAVGETL